VSWERVLGAIPWERTLSDEFANKEDRMATPPIRHVRTEPEEGIMSDDDFLRELASFDDRATIPEIPPQGRNVSHFGGRLPERRFLCRRGHPFAMVFAYPSPDAIGCMGSPMIYTGDLRTIKEELLEEPTHHGFVVHYRGGQRLSRPQGRMVVLFGKHSFHYQRRLCSLVLDYVHPRDSTMRRRSVGRMKRAGFYLLFHNEHGQEKVLHRWRRLPKTYLQQLKEADEYLDQHLG
jgi:hypothetical protein